MNHLLQHYASGQAQRRPDATAVVMGDERLSYGELDDRSSRLATLLRDAGCRRGDRVGLLLDKSPTALVSMLATLKVCCAYVPLDVASPPARLARVLRSAEPRVVVAEDESSDVLSALIDDGALSGAVIGWLGRDRAPSGRWQAAFDRFDVESATATDGGDGRPEDTAHLLFTSGSTGEPKGVVISHANVRAFVEWARRYFGLDESDRLSGQPPLHFDLSTFDIYGTFSAGAQLHLVSTRANVDASALADVIRTAQLTQWFSVPSVMTFMARFGVIADRDFPSLRRVLWCGEVLPTPVLRHWMTRVPQATYTNLYGPTEATIASSCHTVTEAPLDESVPIPIGRACAGEELLVLDEQLQPVGVGEVGDLYIAGVGLSSGYWRDPEKTRAAFVTDPRRPGVRIYKTGDLARVDEDGVFHFLGRADSQIKSRGYRIELGEIESALNTLTEINEVAVVAVPMDGFEAKAICCAYAPAPGVRLEPAEVRQRLTRLVPSYMLPTRWLVLERLPKNVNGKIDRARLKELFTERREREASGGDRSAAQIGRAAAPRRDIGPAA